MELDDKVLAYAERFQPRMEFRRHGVRELNEPARLPVTREFGHLDLADASAEAARTGKSEPRPRVFTMDRQAPKC